MAGIETTSTNRIFCWILARLAAEIHIEVEESALPDASLMVQANHEGRTATRKFELRKAD